MLLHFCRLCSLYRLYTDLVGHQIFLCCKATSLPMLLLLVLFIFFMRQLQVGGGKAMSFGKSRAKISTDDRKKVTFDDVAGADEEKDELKEIVEFLKIIQVKNYYR